MTILLHCGFMARARGKANANSDYDLAVLFKQSPADDAERRLQPELLALDWQQATSVLALSIIDIMQVPLPLAITVLDVALWSANGNSTPEISDVWTAFPYIVYCQTLAFYKALQLGISPDNPCPGGEVNRVVQGVTIYPLPEVETSPTKVGWSVVRGNH